MHLMRCLFFVVLWGFSIQAAHIAGKSNVAADAISQDNIHQFFQQVPAAAEHQPTQVPNELQLLLGYWQVETEDNCVLNSQAI